MTASPLQLTSLLSEKWSDLFYSISKQPIQIGICDNFPEELFIDIIEALGRIDKVQCQLVSRQWYLITSRANFWYQLDSHDTRALFRRQFPQATDEEVSTFTTSSQFKPWLNRYCLFTEKSILSRVEEFFDSLNGNSKGIAFYYKTFWVPHEIESLSLDMRSKFARTLEATNNLVEYLRWFIEIKYLTPEQQKKMKDDPFGLFNDKEPLNQIDSLSSFYILSELEDPNKYTQSTSSIGGVQYKNYIVRAYTGIMPDPLNEKIRDITNIKGATKVAKKTEKSCVVM